MSLGCLFSALERLRSLTGFLVQRFRDGKNAGKLTRIRKDGHLCYTSRVPRRLDSDRNWHSSLQLYEDGKLIGPAHCLHQDIRELGAGRYSHWGSQIYFSTPDNSDPRTNGRTYAYEVQERNDSPNCLLSLSLPAVVYSTLTKVFASTSRHCIRAIRKEIVNDNERFEEDLPGSKDLKVVQYIGTLGPGGAERQLCNLAIALRRLGPDVAVLTSNPLEGEHAHYAPLLLNEGIPVRQASSCSWDAILSKLSSPLDVSKSVLKSLPFYLSTTLWPIVNELISIRPHILHCWLDYCNIVGGLAGILAGVPRIIISGRNVNPTWMPMLSQPWFNDWYKLVCESNRVIFINNSLVGAKDYAQWIGIPSSTVRVIYNGMDFCGFDGSTADDVKAFKDSIGIGDSEPLIAGVFRLSDEKRPFDFLKVVKIVHNSVPGVKVAVAGIGHLEHALREEIGKAGLQGTVQLLGRRKDIPVVLKAADLVLHTSDCEGNPNALLEAQYLGVPVVATKAGGTPEVVLEGVTGLLHNIGDIDGLASSVIRLLQDKAYGRMLGEAGRKLVKEKFSIGRMVDDTLRLYSSSQQIISRTSELNICSIQG